MTFNPETFRELAALPSKGSPMTDEERDLIERVGVAPTAYRYVHLDYAGRKISRYGAHAERVNGHDPIEAHALYEAGQIAALIEERDRLREENARLEKCIHQAVAHYDADDDEPARAVDAVEMCRAALQPKDADHD